MNVYLIYASTSGNVEITIEFIAKLLSYMGFETKLIRSEQTNIGIIVKNNKFVFATSTWDHGKINPFFVNLFESMQKHNFQNKQAAFLGLGDRRYEPVFFCRAIDQIRDLWLEKGGQAVLPTLKIQGEPYDQLPTIVAPWANLLARTWAYKND
ncbi:MAG: YkuP protein [Candidatus Curtissbacteria bacterium GW2011_GWA1_40_9]|uniref:YkuP protein n=1 Tax=Candidatus Curtissbacteria bacterium GW2011_GWA1_40_9 TaxID=1618408 RepID=A0A0G0TU66_9BACT|nr:MAG: YkuP protein [Candidatus Curtissbacteria bacterium GW2011_GWA1_40_9]